MTGTIKLTALNNPNIWKRRITMKCGWTVIAVSVLLLRVGSAISIDAVESSSRSWIAASTSAPKSVGGRPTTDSVQTVATQAVVQDVCYSPGCMEAASSVIKNMDSSIDACEDFYKFACGRFINSTIIPADRESVDEHSIIEDKLNEELRASFESESRPEEPKHFKIVKNLYKSCMNETAIEEIGSEPLLNLLKKLGGWPVLDGAQWDEDAFDWIKMMAKFRDAGYYMQPFIDVKITTDEKNGTIRVIELSPTSIGPTWEFFGYDDEVVQAYYRHMVDVAVILGADKHLAETDLMESFQFAIELANITAPEEQRATRSWTSVRLTLKELTEKYASVPWKEYLTNVMPRGISIEDDEIVHLWIPSYISDLVQLMSSTPKRVQANHVMWLATSMNIGYLNDELRKQHHELQRLSDDTTESLPRWRSCLAIVSEHFPHNVGATYVKKYFNRQTKLDVVEIFEDINKKFVTNLRQVEWLDEKTRQRALEKANAMTSYIGYFDEILDDRKVDLLYEKFQFSDDHYFENMFNMNRLHQEEKFNGLGKPAYKNKWDTDGAALVNGRYVEDQNAIVISAAILQGVFFRHDQPRYMNYGAIGSVIGHEIIHGFDNGGRGYDKNGNKVNWWEPSSDAEYSRRTQCILDQYGNYTVEINGTIHNLLREWTQDENIADNGGTKLAYFTYDDWLKGNKTEQQLPGLDYTNRQMFWISYANTFCSKHSLEDMKLVILYSHSPKEFRVLGPLSNTPEFAKDFNCPLGSKMNPVKKCSLW